MYVDPMPLSAYPWYLKPLLWWQRRRQGVLPGAVRLWARCPRLFLPVRLLERAFRRRAAPLEPALQALVALRVGQLNECAYTVDESAHALHQYGVDWSKIRAVGDWRESEAFSNREQVVLDYAEAVTRTEAPVGADTIGAVKRHLDEEALIELTGLIGYRNMTTKFNATLDLPPRGFCTMTVNARGEAVPWEANTVSGT
ncbi:MAG: carboxymuconolactone decarboxylase family protein [Halorhodospira sp.]